MLEDISNLNQSTANPTKKFYDVLMGNNVKQDNLLNMVKNAGGDVEHTKALIDTLGRVVNTPVQTIIKGTRVAAENSIKEANQEGIVKAAIENLTKGRYNKELFNLSLGGESSQARIWGALSKLPVEDRIVGLHNVLEGMKYLGAEGAQIPAKAVIHNNTPDSTPTNIYKGISSAVLGR